MPLKLNVGLTKKVGEANYGSRGASVNFDVEIEANLVQEPDQLRDKIRYLFGLAKVAVEEELNGQQQPNNNGQRPPSNNGHHSNGNGNGSHRTPNGRSATASQVRAIHAIATRNGVDLALKLSGEFGVSKPDELSIGQASELIDSLKSQTNGSGGRR